jgi:hypothetical protein
VIYILPWLLVGTSMAALRLDVTLAHRMAARRAALVADPMAVLSIPKAELNAIIDQRDFWAMGAWEAAEAWRTISVPRGLFSIVVAPPFLIAFLYMDLSDARLIRSYRK